MTDDRKSLDIIERPTLRDACLQMAEDAAHVLASALAKDGSAFIAVPGGTSPAPFFASLAERELEWAKIRVTLTDERWVPDDSAESNARLVRASLLQGPGASASFSPPLAPNSEDVASLEEAAAKWDFALKMAPAFDLVVLGMGEDGHFASLFPGGETLAKNLDPTSDVLAVPIDDRSPKRLSLTLSAIVRAKKVMLLIGGEKKRDLLGNVLRGDPQASALPIAALLRHATAAPTCYLGVRT